MKTLLENPVAHENSPVCLCYFGKEVIGWGCVMANTLHVFVSRKHRRKGVGSKIYHHLYRKGIMVRKWNYRSKKFYDSLERITESDE